MRTHSFTTSQVLPINDARAAGVSPSTPSGNTFPAGTVRTLPPSTIYGFNGTFPGPRINAEYGKPVLVRFENHLDENPLNLDRQDFGSPDFSFLTHLHNGHTAPESDGNPHYSMLFGPKAQGYPVKSFVDNLYLNWPAGNDDREKQTFFWFHDHRMDHTGVERLQGNGRPLPDLRPEERHGRRRRDDRVSTCRVSAPTTPTARSTSTSTSRWRSTTPAWTTAPPPTRTSTTRMGEFPAAGNPRTHPEWWGKTFYKHFPNHGFVGDMFTVNGTAYPVLEVKRRKYRFRFLDCLDRADLRVQADDLDPGPEGRRATSGYATDGDLQGQWRIEDAQQCMKWTEIADDGGLLPVPIVRDSFELWPAKRREHIVDFTKYMDGTPTKKGDVIYLTNVMRMPDGRMWSNSSRFLPDPKYKIPMIKIVIGDDAPDASVIPAALRDLPPLPANWQNLLDDRLIFEVQRGQRRR